MLWMTSPLIDREYWKWKPHPPFSCLMQRCFNGQPLVTSYVIDAYLRLAMLHAWTQCAWWGYLRRPKAFVGIPSWRRPTGRPRKRLAQQCPGGCRRYTAVLPTLWRSEIMPGVTERRNGTWLGLRDDDGFSAPGIVTGDSTLQQRASFHMLISDHSRSAVWTPP